jgi:hypothetical protein
MGIPIISDVLDGAKYIITTFIDKAPKPLKIAIFLSLLVGAIVVIPFMLHIFGVHCNYDGDAVKTSPFSFLTNIKLALIDANQVYNKSSYEPENIGLLGLPVSTDCVKHVCIVGDTVYYASDPECDNQTKRYIFLSKNYEWTRCVVCDGDTNYTSIQSSFTLGGENDYYCYGDATPIPDTDKSWFQNWVCNPEQRCVPPANYYFESDTGTYDCVDSVSCGQNDTEIRPLIDQELAEVDAELLYPNIDDKDYRSAFKFTCDRDNQPQMAFFGIPLFSLKLWLLLIVLGVMFIFLKNIKSH